MELKEIKELIALMKKNDLSVFKMEREGFKITLKKGVHFSAGGSPVPPPVAAPVAATPASVAVAVAEPATPQGTEAGVGSGREILSPMVGTFYRSPSPDAPPFVEVGSAVTPDTVVCIIEAMKVMNEIKAETSGVIAEVLVENTRPVQFGQPLFRLR